MTVKYYLIFSFLCSFFLISCEDDPSGPPIAETLDLSKEYGYIYAFDSYSNSNEVIPRFELKTKKSSPPRPRVVAVDLHWLGVRGNVR